MQGPLLGTSPPRCIAWVLDAPTGGIFYHVVKHEGNGMAVDCRVIKVSKGRGRFRTIYSPNDELRAVLAGHYAHIRDTMLSACDYRVCNGFMPGRSPSTNACYHVGYQYTLSMDLKDFFDTVNESHLTGFLEHHVLSDCLWEGVARQGLPTSPMLANIAACNMDATIKRIATERGMVYTRYADDLTISGNDRQNVFDMREIVTQAAADRGFVVNESKTEFQSASAGRRRITGLSVDDMVHVPRRLRRKSRAARHQGHMGSAEGLIAWAGSPSFICPVCWNRSAHKEVSTCISMHFDCNSLPDSWWSMVKSMAMPSWRGSIAAYLRTLVVERGGIRDYSDLYEEIRSQYAIQALSGLSVR